MKWRSQNLRDIALFGRVLSTGLVVAGYAFLGVWLSRWLDANDYPTWLSFGALLCVVIFGMWQGWLFLTKNARGNSPSSNSRQGQKQKRDNK